MSNSTFARPINLPTGWNKVRVGLRLTVGDLGVNPGSTPRFAFGLCHGTTNIIGDATCDNAIGAITNSASWARGGVGYAGMAVTAFTKVGSTLTTGGTLIGGSGIALAWTRTVAPFYRNCYLLDITKGSPNYTVALYYWSPGTTADVQDYDFYQAMLISGTMPSTLGAGASAYLQGPNASMAFDESTFNLNALGVWFNRSDFLLEIQDIAVSILS